MRFLRYGALAAIALLLVGSLVIAGCGQKLAASVNGTGIPISKIDDGLKRLESMRGDIFKGPESEKRKAQYRKQLLDYLINEQLVRQQAEKEKVTVTDKEVDGRFSEMQKSSKKSLKEIEKILKDQGTSVAEFKDGLKTQMIAQKLVQKLTADVKVTDEEAKQYYEKNKDTDADIKEAEKVKTLQILTEKEEDAKKAKAELDGGADFTAVSKKYSIDPSKDKGGEQPVYSRDKVVPEWAKEVFARKPGETTGAFKTSFGYHIVKVLEKFEAKQRSFEESKELIKQKELTRKKNNAFQDWLEGARKKGNVKIYIDLPKDEGPKVQKPQGGK
ncbi:MAG: peptidyl-prolyl cis-trans isomerase [Actinobacteria bacterium]|nr:peptidyl-prolyl cis-trans isomerase [Actinomycetota bacterium]